MTIRKRTKKRAAAGIAAVTSAGLVSAGLFAMGGIGSADPISKTLDYTCPFPLIGNQNVNVTINTDIPSSIEAGQETGRFDIVSVANAGQEATEGLNLVGADTIEGDAVMASHVEAPGVDLDVKVPNDIPSTKIPPNGNDLILENITGATPSLTFNEPGTGVITLHDMLLTMTPRDENGDETGLGTFESECSLVDGQDNVLHTFEITPGGGGGDPEGGEPEGGEPEGGEPEGGEPEGGEPEGGEPEGGEPEGGEPEGGEPEGGEPEGGGGGEPIDLAFDLNGQTHINAANGDVVLSGGIDIEFDLPNQVYEADLTLDPTSGEFLIMGFFTAEADIEFEQTARTNGTFDGDTVTSWSQMHVYLTEVSSFGFPIGGGPDCRTVEPMVVEMQGQGFDPFQGGSMSGEYTLPPVENCGSFNDMISMFTAGPGNTIEVHLSPKGSGGGEEAGGEEAGGEEAGGDEAGGGDFGGGFGDFGGDFGDFGGDFGDFGGDFGDFGGGFGDFGGFGFGG